jgi:hypothetical protein
MVETAGIAAVTDKPGPVWGTAVTDHDRVLDLHFSALSRAAIVLTPCLNELEILNLGSKDEMPIARPQGYFFRAATDVRWPPKDGQPTPVLEQRPAARKTNER